MKTKKSQTVVLSPELYDRTMAALAEWIQSTEGGIRSLIPSRNADEVPRWALQEECRHLADLVALEDELRALAPARPKTESSRVEAA